MPTSPNYTLTGVIETVTGSADQGKVRLQLAGYGAQVIPSVTGTAQFPDPLVEATCDVTGAWSATVFGCDQYYQDNNPDPLYYDITPISGDGTTGNTVPYRLVGGGSHDITALIPYVVPAPATTPTKTEYIGDVFVSGIPSTRQMLTGLTSTVADWEYPVPEEIELSRYLASVAPGKIIHAAAVTTSGSAIVTVASGYSVWTSADVGKKVRLTASRVNSPGTDEFHTIASVQSGTQITLNSAVTNSDTSVTVEWWSSTIEASVTAALVSAMAACRPGQQTIKIPDGVYPVTSYPTWNVYCKTIRGGGVSSSRIVPANATVTGSLFPISSSGWVSIRDIGLTGPMYQDGTVITAYSITSNVVTFTATNTFTAGQVVLIQGFLGTGTIFNNTKFTILASGLSGSQFAANFTNADTSGTDTGVACVDINCIVTPTTGLKHLDMERVEISYWPGDGLQINPVFLSSFREVTVHHCGGDFDLLPVSGAGVTTCHFDTTWAFKSYKAGYYLGKGNTVSFSNAAGDRNGVNFYLDGVVTFGLYDCDSEQPEYHNAAYQGFHYWNHGAQSGRLDNCEAFTTSISDARGTLLVCDNGAKRITIENFRHENAVSAVLPTYAWTIDSTCSFITIKEFGFGTVSPSAFIDNGVNTTYIRSGAHSISATTFTLINTTAATNTVPQSSPLVSVYGQSWDGSATNKDGFTIQAVPGSGANPSTQLQFKHVADTSSGGSSYAFGTSGQFTFGGGGLISVYGGNATVAQGVAWEQAQANITAQTANVGITVLVGASAKVGLYRVSVSIEISQAATTSSTMPDTRIKYTDQETGVVITRQVTAGSTANTTSTFANASFIVNSAAAANISYDIGQVTPYASSGATAMQFVYRARLEYLG